MRKKSCCRDFFVSLRPETTASAADRTFPQMKGVYTILLLIVSNIFMTFAWYGHLKL